jgi:hypothetical protein
MLKNFLVNFSMTLEHKHCLDDAETAGSDKNTISLGSHSVNKKGFGRNRVLPNRGSSPAFS